MWYYVRSMEGDEGGVVGVVVVNSHCVLLGGGLGIGWGCRCGSV